MMSLPSCNELASYSEHIAGDFDWTQDGLIPCDYCGSTGKVPEKCLCGNEVELGLKLCPEFHCGRIVNYTVCPDCKGKGKRVA